MPFLGGMFQAKSQKCLIHGSVDKGMELNVMVAYQRPLPVARCCQLSFGRMPDSHQELESFQVLGD